ncbi:MAG: oligosaccharide flippase family protein [Arcobacteraceae bacterium]
MTKTKSKKEFTRNVLTLLTGTTIAQAIPIAVSPILTRIYTPEDFGVLALFLSITFIISSIVSGAYEYAIMLPKNEKDAINIFVLGLIIVIITTCFFTVVILLFKDNIIQIIGNEELSLWLYFVPISVFFVGIFNLLNYYNNRLKNYRAIAESTIIKSFVMVFIQLLVGITKSGAVGLISGHLISQVVSNIKLLKGIFKDKMLICQIKRLKIIALAKRYKNFPKFSMMALFANSLSNNLVQVFITSLYNTATLGFYFLVQRVLGIPSILIGNAIGQVFLQEAIKEKQQTSKTINAFNMAFVKLAIIACLTFGILFFYVDELFAIVFGKDWEIAGKYAQILIPLFFFKFISSSLSVVLIVFEKQKIELLINVILIFISVLAIFISYSIENFLYILSYSLSICYIVFLIYYYNLALKGGKSVKKSY